MINILLDIYMVIMYIALGFASYYALLYFIGLFTHKQKYKLVDDKLKFCIFVPCHNEGSVIGATVKNYRNIAYNKNLFDIYFIADNCSDNTAEEIKRAIDSSRMENEEENFYVLERNVDEPTKRGKPHALRWAIDKLEENNSFYAKYEMFMILDADNFVDAEILTHINSQYLSYKEKNRPAMIQTYLDSKNNENIISRGYYVSYRISNGFFQLPKHKLGLVPAIGGTGFAMETTFLKDIGGYNCKSLTEDLEIQTIATLKCKKIAYNGNIRIYDEKPTGVKQSLVQRTRWSQGHWYNFFKYSIPLIISLFNFKQIKFFLKKIDVLIYLSVKVIIVLGIISLFISGWFIIAGIVPQIPLFVLILNIIFSVLAVLLVPLSSYYDGTKLEKKKAIKYLIPNYIAIVVVSVIDIIASIIGLFKCTNQTTWKKTAHKVVKLNNEEEI